MTASMFSDACFGVWFTASAARTLTHDPARSTTLVPSTTSRTALLQSSRKGAPSWLLECRLGAFFDSCLTRLTGIGCFLRLKKCFPSSLGRRGRMRSSARKTSYSLRSCLFASYGLYFARSFEIPSTFVIPADASIALTSAFACFAFPDGFAPVGVDRPPSSSRTMTHTEASRHFSMGCGILMRRGFEEDAGVGVPSLRSGVLWRDKSTCTCANAGSMSSNRDDLLFPPFPEAEEPTNHFCNASTADVTCDEDTGLDALTRGGAITQEAHKLKRLTHK
mmetsp:Transcript_7404/g.19303  ORF Transcript_7404/g.19303 Transcript_7404/m.19303 type:complete len:278 (+) Transcript_7404:326-1159(+)